MDVFYRKLLSTKEWDSGWQEEDTVVEYAIDEGKVLKITYEKYSNTRRPVNNYKKEISREVVEIADLPEEIKSKIPTEKK